MQPVYPNLEKVQHYWVPFGTQQTMCPLLDNEGADKPKGRKKSESAMAFESALITSSKSSMDPSKGCHSPTIAWEKHIHLWTPLQSF